MEGRDFKEQSDLKKNVKWLILWHILLYSFGLTVFLCTFKGFTIVFLEKELGLCNACFFPVKCAWDPLTSFAYLKTKLLL